MSGKRTQAFVLLAGGGMGAWIWERVVPHLEHPAIALDKRVAAGLDRPTIGDCADYVAREIRDAGVDQAILVAHSGAGVIAAAVAGRAPALRHIVFVSAGIPAEGTNALHGLPLPVRILNAVAMRMNARAIPARSREKIIRNAFTNASPEEVVEHMLRQEIRPEPPCLAFEKVRRAGLPRVPATYVKLLSDRTITVRGQERMIANYGGMESVSIDADHMVMLSKPQALAEVLNAAGRAAGWRASPVSRSGVSAP